MCGIFGYVLGGARQAPSLAAALPALRHRGPDDANIWEEDRSGLRVGFAHTRLSILDLSPEGRQPMMSRDGRYVITYNGETYNFPEVRAQLEALGETFTSTGDTQVVLAAYARWGAAALDRLRGMFAFAIWDRQDQRLFLARDRMGVKPLYVVERPDGIVFASELRTLLATGAVPARLSRTGLTSYLTLGSVRDPDTMIDGVRALPPGHRLERTRDRTVLERYWTLPLRNRERFDRQEGVEELRATLQESVKLRLVADVPVGVFLSSGVDSTAIVALAAKASSAPVQTFTVTFDAGDDEGELAAETARRFGCRHDQAHVSMADVAARIQGALAALDQPSMDGTNTYFVSEVARKAGLVVALSGIGGDELFAGYAAFRRFALVHVLRRALMLPAFTKAPLARITRRPGLPNELRKSLALLDHGGGLDAPYRVLRGVFVPSQVEAMAGARMNGERTMKGAVDDALATGSIDAVNAYGALELSNYLEHTLLRDTDAMSMAHSLEVREPLLDHVLVEQAMRIPGGEKLRGIGAKPLFTEAVPDVGEGPRRRPKRGFELPFEAWLRGPLREWTAARLLERPTPWLARAEVEGLWRNFAAGGRGVTWTRVWCLAVLSDWCERYKVAV